MRSPTSADGNTASRSVAGCLTVAWLCLVAGCVTTTPETESRDGGLIPDAWLYANAWKFELFDQADQSIGHVTLLLTHQPATGGRCTEGRWLHAVLVENEADIDFGLELKPAYQISGPWIRIDLTASLCDLDYVLIGDMLEDGGRGFFNYSHALGGRPIGRFTAEPLMQ